MLEDDLDEGMRLTQKVMDRDKIDYTTARTKVIKGDNGKDIFPMELDLYRRRAGETAIYPEKGDRSKNAINYCLVGLAGEIGETLNKWKKILRGDKPLDEAARLAFGKELGGVLWYLSQAAWEFGWDFDDIARMNLDELKDRNSRGVIQGDGDNR